nr:hypothetical protein [Tanacetum cinerariifolium]
MSSDSHATITYTLMLSYEVIVNRYYEMPMDPLDLYVQLVMGAPPLRDYILGPEAPPSPDYIPGPKYLEYLPPADDMLPAKEQPLPVAVSPTAGWIPDSEEEEEEHLASTVPAPALYSSVSESNETEPFEEGENAATPPPFGYRVAARISADIPLRKRARFTTPTSRYEIGESTIAAAAARQIRPTLTIADKRRADDKL